MKFIISAAITVLLLIIFSSCKLAGEADELIDSAEVYFRQEK